MSDSGIFFLVGIHHQSESPSEAIEKLAELRDLINTLGFQPFKEDMLIKLRKESAGYLIGKGKIEELALTVEMNNISTVVFDYNLSPARQRNLEEAIGVPVVDRREIILQVFFEHAGTKDAALQVELALLKYQLPRITGAWDHLSRQKGGTKGTRDSGEKQIEMDKRIIAQRIKQVQKELTTVAQGRKTLRKRREASGMIRVAVAGYTNAGKSSLINRLTKSDLLAADQLFATLDTSSRRYKLEGGRTVVLTDTVGFIRGLPHDLVEAFKSTLEETRYSDFIFHVVDASDPAYPSHMETTSRVLGEIGAGDIPMILVFNKVESLSILEYETLRASFPEGCFVSAKTGMGLEQIDIVLKKKMEEKETFYDLLLPHSRGDLIAAVHNSHNFRQKEVREEGVYFNLSLVHSNMAQFGEFII